MLVVVLCVLGHTESLHDTSCYNVDVSGHCAYNKLMWMSVVIKHTIYRIAVNFHGRKLFRILWIHCHLRKYFPRFFSTFLYCPILIYWGEKLHTQIFFPVKIPILRLSQNFSTTKKFCYAGMHTLNSSCMYVRQTWT